jgi:hypothetical protein
MLLATEGLLAGWAYWQTQAGVLWWWPLVVVTASVAYGALWLLAGASAAGVVVAMLSLAIPARDVFSRAIAIFGLVAHLGVLGVVTYLLVVVRW